MRFVHDPGLLNLRRGLRVAIVVPVLYAVLLNSVGATAALYGSFAAFASLVFADFQGSSRRKLEGYTTLAVLGSLLVLLGSLSADLPVLPVVAIFVVTFAIRFVGCLGGYAIAAGTTLMLAFALSVLTTPVEQVPERVFGWIAGCVSAALAALVAAVPRELIARDRIAAQCRTIASDLRAVATGGDRIDLDPTVVREVREELAKSSSRPLTPSVGQTALTALMDAVGRATLVLQHVPPVPAGIDPEDLADLNRLAIVGADGFDAAADALTDGAIADLTPIRDALDAHRASVLAALRTSDPQQLDVIERLAASITRVRLVASMAAAAATDAAVWSGHRSPPRIGLDVEVGVPEAGAAAFWSRARRILGFHLRWESTRFRNSLRAAVALTAAFLVARAVAFDHGFWVVLGALMVLRSGANDTAATALQALRGTLIGFAVAAPIAYLADGQDTLLWFLLPLVAFVAAWAPGAIGLGSGQAAFTIFVVVLFNLAVPFGVQTAVLRLETVATGIAVAVAVGFVFWPRGPQASVGPMTGRLYRASGALVGAVAVDVLDLPGSTGALRAARQELIAAREQLDETLQELSADRRANVELTDRVAMLTPPALVAAGDWTSSTVLIVPDGVPARPTPAPDLEAQAFEVQAAFDAVAAWLDDATLPTRELTASDPEPPTLDGVEPTRFLRRIWLWSWLTTLDHSIAGTADDTLATIRDLPRRWWR